MRPAHDEEQFRAEAGITIAMREEQRRLSGGPDRCTRMNSDGAISCPPTFASAPDARGRLRILDVDVVVVVGEDVDLVALAVEL